MIPAEIYTVDAVPKLGSGKTDFGAAEAPSSSPDSSLRDCSETT